MDEIPQKDNKESFFQPKKISEFNKSFYGSITKSIWYLLIPAFIFGVICAFDERAFRGLIIVFVMAITYKLYMVEG